MIIDLQIVAEEEELVLLDRTPDISAKIVVGEVSNRLIEKVSRIEIAVSGEFVGRAVIAIRTGLENNVGDRAAGPAQLRVVVTGGHVHCLDGFQRRYDDLQQTGAFVVVDTLNLVVITHAQLAVDLGLKRTAGVEELRVLESRTSRAGHDVQQVLVIAIGAERYVLGQDRFDFASGVGSLGLQDRSFRFNSNGVRNVPRLKDQVDALGRVHDYINASSRRALEP